MVLWATSVSMAADLEWRDLQQIAGFLFSLTGNTVEHGRAVDIPGICGWLCGQAGGMALQAPSWLLFRAVIEKTAGPASCAQSSWMDLWASPVSMAVAHGIRGLQRIAGFLRSVAGGTQC